MRRRPSSGWRIDGNPAAALAKKLGVSLVWAVVLNSRTGRIGGGEPTRKPDVCGTRQAVGATVCKILF